MLLTSAPDVDMVRGTTRHRVLLAIVYAATAVLMFHWAIFGIDNANALVGHHSALLDVGLVASVVIAIAALVGLVNQRWGAYLAIAGCIIAAVPLAGIFATLDYRHDLRFHHQPVYSVLGSGLGFVVTVVLCVRTLRQSWLGKSEGQATHGC